jgi:hypothetical protein
MLILACLCTDKQYKNNVSGDVLVPVCRPIKLQKKKKKVLLKMGVSAPRSKMRPDQVVHLVLLPRRLKQLIWCRSLGQRHEAAANSGLGSTLPAR